MKFLRTKFLKGILISTLIVAAPILARASSPYEESSRDKTMVIFSSTSVGVAVTTYSILVDLSDTVNFPHKESGEIDLSRIDILVDKAAASTGTIKIGVVNAVGASSGSVTWFLRDSFERNVSNTNPNLSFNLDGMDIKTHANGHTPGGNVIGTTPYILSNDKTTQSSVFQSTVPLPTPFGNAAPGVGDIVMYASNNDFTSTITVSINLLYHSHQRK